jgi:drug/metabolite transporter (DMT)-like permease
MKLLKSHFGPLLIALGSLLWATDALIRYPASASLSSTVIVWFEHMVAVLILLPMVLSKKQRADLFRLNRKDWFAVLITGFFGSALGTVFLGESFRYVNPSVSILIQKLQPILVVLIAFLFLGERPKRKFYPWAMVAFFAAIVLSFPDLKFDFLGQANHQYLKGLLYALGATVFWGFSTVAGKALLNHHSPEVSTFWRYFFGATLLSVLVFTGQDPGVPWHIVFSKELFLPLMYLSTLAGVFPMFIYYAGLKRTTASVTTFVELLYPVGGIALNTLFLHASLSGMQLAAGAVLLFAVTMISL